MISLDEAADYLEAAPSGRVDASQGCEKTPSQQAKNANNQVGNVPLFHPQAGNSTARPSMDENTATATVKWQPLERVDRRVLGVLIEKAKTTPDNYPLSRNALVNGSNQKSNRFPQMQLDEEDVYDALERLKKVGAASQIQSDGRVDKYRHLAYDWLGVDKVELAVMGELLLRGAQTLGELRGRAARMEPIADIATLRPILDSLQNKGLLIYLTPPGRGCVVTHALYQPQELDKVKAEHGGGAAASAPVAPSTAPTRKTDDLSALQAEVAELRDRVKKLETAIAAVTG